MWSQRSGIIMPLLKKVFQVIECKVGTFLLCDASMLKWTRVTVLRFHCGEENGFYIDVILPVVVCSSMPCVCCHSSVVINNSCECSHKGEEYSIRILKVLQKKKTCIKVHKHIIFLMVMSCHSLYTLRWILML